MTSRQKRIVSVVLPLQFVSAVLARRDLAQRSESEVRGSKRFWSVFIWLNVGNSLLYWLVGRRELGTASSGG